MKHIDNYKLFLEKSKINEILNISRELKRVFESINNENFRKIINKIGTEIESFPYKNLSLGKTNTTISITPSGKEINDNDYSKYRQDIKCGRIFSLILPELTGRDIEIMVNEYAAEIEYINNQYANFDIVDGDDIETYYNDDNYVDYERGTMHHSCMLNTNYLDLYTQNPEVVRMLILKDDKDNTKIKGRALVWRLDNGKYFMDRVYTSNDKLTNLFIKYAIEKDWLFKENQSYGGSIIDKDNNRIGSVSVYLDGYEYDTYPYLDTLYYFKDGRLSNYKFDDECKILNSTNGECEGGSDEDRLEQIMEMSLEEIIETYGTRVVISNVDEREFIKDVVNDEVNILNSDFIYTFEPKDVFDFIESENYNLDYITKNSKTIKKELYSNLNDEDTEIIDNIKKDSDEFIEKLLELNSIDDISDLIGLFRISEAKDILDELGILDNFIQEKAKDRIGNDVEDVLLNYGYINRDDTTDNPKTLANLLDNYVNFREMAEEIARNN
jgi:hypothetical protein